jgi:epoxyqueuosine reductase
VTQNSFKPASVKQASVKQDIAEKAREIGFDTVGFAAAGAVPDGGKALAAYVGAGHHGSMGWMVGRTAERAHPTGLWPETRTVIALAMNYAPPIDPLELLAHGERGSVAAYARGRDYHDVMKPMLKRLARWIAETHDAGVKVFVDTAPVMEKPAAAAGGLGWQGKHTNLVSRTHGSWLFLGEIFTTLDLPPDEPEKDHCGSCRSCLDACPTDAFPAPGKLDARRCISYLTIEHKGHIAPEFRTAMGNRIYGCDDCLAVCPWNKYATRTRHYAFLPRIELTAPKLADLAGLDDAGFRRVFSGSSIKRIGRDRFVRNVLIAIGNSALPALAPVARRLLGDPAPVVRAMAVWALSRLLSPNEFHRLAAVHQGEETDADVAAEWQCADAPPAATTVQEASR